MKGTTMINSNLRRPLTLAVAVAVAALCVAACGSSSNAGTTKSTSTAAAAGGTGVAARSKFVACLKAHGVTLPARPPSGGTRPPGTGTGPGSGQRPPGGGGFFFFGGGGAGPAGGAGGAAARGRFDNPKFQAAFKACGGGSFPRRRFTLSHTAVSSFVACVRKHGYKLPAPNFSGKGPVFPAKIESNKAFQAAAKPCVSLLRPPGAPGGAGAAGGAATTSSSTGNAKD
jgi:hypothetical protein